MRKTKAKIEAGHVEECGNEDERKEDDELSLIKKWGSFSKVIFGPGSFIFIVLTAMSLFLSYQFKENLMFSTLLTVLAALFSGFAGSFIKDDYEKINNEHQLEKKGKSAVRTLSSIDRQIVRIKNYITEKISTNKQSKEDDFLIELSRHLFSVQDQLSSGLEDWVDIVPNLRKEISIINQITELESEIDQLSKKEQEYQNSHDKDQKLKTKLQEDILQKETSMRLLERRLERYQFLNRNGRIHGINNDNNSIRKDLRYRVVDEKNENTKD